MSKKPATDKVGVEVISLVVQIEWKPRPSKHVELGIRQQPSRIMLSTEGRNFYRVDLDRFQSADGQFRVAIAGEGGSERSERWGVDLVAWKA